MFPSALYSGCLRFAALGRTHVAYPRLQVRPLRFQEALRWLQPCPCCLLNYRVYTEGTTVRVQASPRSRAYSFEPVCSRVPVEGVLSMRLLCGLMFSRALARRFATPTDSKRSGKESKNSVTGAAAGSGAPLYEGEQEIQWLQMAEVGQRHAELQFPVIESALVLHFALCLSDLRCEFIHLFC